MICLDTNIIYSFLFETELTSASEKVIMEAIVEGMAIPMIVYNELLYTTGAKIVIVDEGLDPKLRNTKKGQKLLKQNAL